MAQVPPGLALCHARFFEFALAGIVPMPLAARGIGTMPANRDATESPT
jgi:hypothetical protein